MSKLKILIEEFSQNFKEDLGQSQNLEELEKVRVKYLGRSGSLTEIVGFLKTLSVEKKRELGPKINELKNTSNKLFQKKKESLERQKEDQGDKNIDFDVTTYKHRPSGSLHIYTSITEEIEDIFISMGFIIASGPEVETSFHNFDALNIPEEHPARDLQDTLWMSSPGLLLRTHTSSVQIRTMEELKPPLRICAPGRVYRNEATDATHDFAFRQVECLVVDKKVSLSNLMGLIKELLRGVFHRPDLKIRVRTSYFPFVEPGLEVDMSCLFCDNGCSVCKHSKWIEMGGAGLVHPNVLENCNIDSKEWAGCAFGFGIERILMLRNQIEDIRLFKSTKIDFLKQF